MTAPPQILVVEDDPNVRGLLETLLSTEGYDVMTASDGLGGLSKLSDAKPALMLLDLMMPDLGGARVLDHVRSDPALADVAILVLTGKLEAVPALRDELGRDNVFVKPFGVNELLARVAQITGGAEAQ